MFTQFYPFNSIFDQMRRDIRRDFSIFDEDDFFYHPTPRYIPLIENTLYQPRMSISQQQQKPQQKQENQAEQYYFSSNTGEANGVKKGYSIEAKTKIINGKAYKNIKKTKYNDDGTRQVQEYIEDEDGYRVNNFLLEDQKQQDDNKMVEEKTQQQLLEPPSIVKQQSSQQLQTHENPFLDFNSIFQDFDNNNSNLSRKPNEDLSISRRSLFDKDDLLFGNAFFNKDIYNWFNTDDLFKIQTLENSQQSKQQSPKQSQDMSKSQPVNPTQQQSSTQQQSEQQQPVRNQQKYTITSFQTIKDGKKTGHIIEKQETNENGKVSRQVKNVTLNDDGTKNVHEVIENEKGKIENIKKLNNENQKIKNTPVDDVMIEDEREIKKN